VLERRRRVLGPDHPDVALALYNIADVLYQEHRYAESATLFREALDIQRHALGARHPDTLDSNARLASVLALMNKKDEAIAELRAAFTNGLDPKDLAELDKRGDFKAISGDPRYLALVAETKQRAAAASTAK
jgi:tetratricopeptide (TPR) repeat protein